MDEALMLLARVLEHGNSILDGTKTVCFYCGGQKTEGSEIHMDRCLFGEIEEFIGEADEMPDKMPPCSACHKTDTVERRIRHGSSRLLCARLNGGCGEQTARYKSFAEAIAPWARAAEERAKLLALVWSDEQNARRFELMDKEAEYCSSRDELAELEGLQARMLAYRQIVAPLPIKEARQMLEELGVAKVPAYSEELPTKKGLWWWKMTRSSEAELFDITIPGYGCALAWPAKGGPMQPTEEMGGLWAECVEPELPKGDKDGN